MCVRVCVREREKEKLPGAHNAPIFRYLHNSTDTDLLEVLLFHHVFSSLVTKVFKLIKIKLIPIIINPGLRIVVHVLL